MDDLGKILGHFKDNSGFIVEEIGIVDTIRGIDRVLFDRFQISADTFDYIILAPIYDANGIPIKGVKEGYGIHKRESSFNPSIENPFSQTQKQKFL
ncbi:MAG: hypothetical protein AABW75_04970 [Nanoarchaeota archaeon]